MIIIGFLMKRDRLQQIVFFIAGAVAILVGTTVIVSANDVEGQVPIGFVRAVQTNTAAELSPFH
jgi:hypothetical protein